MSAIEKAYKQYDGNQVLVLGKLKFLGGRPIVEIFSRGENLLIPVNSGVFIAERGCYGGLDDEYKRYRCGQCCLSWRCDTEERHETCEFFVPIPEGERRPQTCDGCPHVCFSDADDWCTCPVQNEEVHPGTLACDYHPKHPEYIGEEGA